jgi:hypothetical protein
MLDLKGNRKDAAMISVDRPSARKKVQAKVHPDCPGHLQLSFKLRVLREVGAASSLIAVGRRGALPESACRKTAHSPRQTQATQTIAEARVRTYFHLGTPTARVP